MKRGRVASFAIGVAQEDPARWVPPFTGCWKQ
jgi:hypothetical protein